MKLDPAEVAGLIDAFEASTWTDVHLCGADFELRLSAGADGADAVAPDDAGVAVAPAATAALTANQTQVLSPSVGIFWRAPSPGAAPFVEVGDEVGAEQTTCIVEVMKLMTQVGAGVDGRIVACLVDNGTAVEQGRPLFVVQS